MTDLAPAIGIHSNPRFKKGLRPRTHNPRFPHLSSFRAHLCQIGPSLVPPTFDNYAKLSGPTGMLGNDQAGDCADAATYHEVEVLTANAQGKEIIPTTALAFQLYSEQAGYDPSKGSGENNPTDVGTNLQDLLVYRMTKGIPLPDGTRSKLVGAFEVDPTNLEDVRLVIATCGYIQLGINCYDAFMSVKPGGMWRVPLLAEPDGGHAIGCGKFDEDGNFWIESWGSFYGMSERTFRKVVTEAYAPVSSEYLAATGKDPMGLTLQTVSDILTQSGLTAVSAEPAAPPAAPPAEPTPAPTAVPAAA